MKSLILLSFITLSTTAYGQFQPKCQAPGGSFIENKLKEAFATAPAEKELRDVVRDQRNYNLREDIKALNRRKHYADRIKMKELDEETHAKFDQMIDTTGRNEDITDWPQPRAFGRLSSNGNAIAIELNNLSKEDLDVLPKPVLDKLSNKVKIEYKYPLDTFDYYLTYDGREYPIDKAMNKIQNDFEDACEQTLAENQNGKDLQDLNRKERKLEALKPWNETVKQQSSQGQGKANQQ